MPRIAFSTFIKFAHLQSHELSAEVERYSSPGSGYDFYKTLRRAAKSFAGNGVNYENAIEPITGLKESTERTYNLAAIQALRKWIQKHKPTLHAPPEHKIYTGPKKKFEIRVEPEFTMQFEDILWNVQLFASQKIHTKPTSCEPALHLLQKKYLGTHSSNAHPAILDLSSGKLLGKKWNTNRAAKNFDHLVDDIARRFE